MQGILSDLVSYNFAFIHALATRFQFYYEQFKSSNYNTNCYKFKDLG